MAEEDVLLKRAEKTREFIEFLHEISGEYELEEFKNNRMIYGSSERFLHLTIEALIDMGNHIISSKNLGSVDNYKDIPRILLENDYIDSDQKELFVKIIGTRNILVHDYLDVDKEIVYRILNKNLGDLEDILKNYLQLL